MERDEEGEKRGKAGKDGQRHSARRCMKYAQCCPSGRLADVRRGVKKEARKRAGGEVVT